MEEDKVGQYLENGITGGKELHPLQKKKYLGTFQERVITSLTKEQVQTLDFLPELEQKMEDHPDAKLLLNGALPYPSLRPYIQLAEKTHNEFSIVQREENETDIFLVLAAKQEVESPDVKLEKEMPKQEENQDESKQSLLDKIKKLLN
ncbi:YueI family protein [Listeria aquatica]|uniref:YueI family protein n=1 Tax=Listeria aquatica TaxID=1494960 RepID=UPI0031F5A275